MLDLSQPSFDAMAAQIHTITASDIVSEFLIDKSDMATVFMSPPVHTLNRLRKSLTYGSST